MFSIRPLPDFTAWLDGLKDKTVRGAILARIRRVEAGLMGDAGPVGGGRFRATNPPRCGWRLYFTQRGSRLIVLLAGGSKGLQAKDIARAKALAALLD